METNRNFNFRTRTKVIAIVDLILTSFSFLFIVLGFLLALHFTVSVVTHDTEPDFNEIETRIQFGKPSADGDNRSVLLILVGVMWLAVLLSIMLLILQIVAAVKLLNSTQVGANPTVAAKQARLWRTVTVIFLVFAVINLGLGGKAANPIAGLIILILRLIGLYIVHNYINELENCSILPNTQVFYNAAGPGPVPQGHGFQGFPVPTGASAPMYPNLEEVQGYCFNQGNVYAYGAPPGGMTQMQMQYAPPPNYEEANANYGSKQKQ